MTADALTFSKEMTVQIEAGHVQSWRRDGAATVEGEDVVGGLGHYLELLPWADGRGGWTGLSLEATARTWQRWMLRIWRIGLRPCEWVGAPSLFFGMDPMSPRSHDRGQAVTWKLKCHPRFDLGGGRGLSRQIHVIDAYGKNVQAFDLMCASINEDVQTAEGSGATALEEIRRIHAGEATRIESDGNAWVAYITPERVWFEGLYSQGEGGEVSFAQYKLAVETYVRFLADPERKPIEVPFPVE